MASAASTETGFVSMVVAMLLAGVLMGRLGRTGAQSIGICYGGWGDNLPSKSEVVQLYKSLNIRRMRIYDPDRGALDALRGSDIEVIIGVPNDQLRNVADQTAANNWVQENIINYQSNVKFRYISVGNEVFPTSSGSYENAPQVLPAMQSIYNAIRSAGLQDQIKVSTAVYPPVLENSFPPSMAAFNDNAAQYMVPIVQFLSSIGAPLLVHVYPYFSKRDNAGISVDFALFKSTEANPGAPEYKNLFDAMVDAFYAALEKAGASSVPLVVSESGWPSAGNALATKENAQTYNQNLIRHVGQGTPKKPGPLETYIFAMFNENLKKGSEEERNFGLFYPDKTPVYQISFN